MKECGDEGDDAITQRDMLDGVSESEIVKALATQEDGTAVASIQKEANQEARAWATQWGVGCFTDDPICWPDSIMEHHAPLLVDTVLRAANTFPTELGLGWDALHPRLLTRVSRSTVELLIKVLLRASGVEVRDFTEQLGRTSPGGLVKERDQAVASQIVYSLALL